MATLASLARNILLNQSIRTTEVKAKTARPMVEKLITLAKENTLTAKRRAFQLLGDHRLVQLLFADIGPRFAGRTGGYTRIVFLPRRRGDGAQLVLMELTEIKKKEVKKPKKQKEARPTEVQAEAAPAAPAPAPEQKPRAELPGKEERPPMEKKPSKKFLGGLRNIFKKERDSL